MKNILNLLKFHIGSLIVYVKKNSKIISFKFISLFKIELPKED